MTFDLDADQIVANAIEVVRAILLEKPIEAETILKQLLRACPDFPPAVMLLGVVKQRTQEYEESARLLEKAVELDPANADAYNNLALSYANLDDYEKSIRCLDKALQLCPDNHLYINNLALQYRQTGRHDVALQLLERALALKEAAEVWCNIGGIYGELKDLHRAENCFLRAIGVNPKLAAAHVDLAFTYHLLGDWKRGFAEYEWRFDHFTQLKYYKKVYDQTKRWDGQADLTGKRILLYGEQGLGDTIQFARFCNDLKARGAYTLLHCADCLKSLLGRFDAVDEVAVADIVNRQDTLPEYDFQCSLMSLPFLLDIQAISGKPYLSPAVSFAYSDYANYFKIGISWAGSPAHPNDSARSTYLKYFRGLHDLPGVKLFNLQVNSSRRIYAAGKRIVDYTEGCDGMKVVDLRPMIQHFDDSATLLGGLDLVVSVDTGLVHLAGAMGVPCLALLPFNPDWRWRIEGNKTEWYDSVELVRQSRSGDWDEVFNQVINAVRKRMTERHQK